ncbi:MAG: family 16 glycosylhydrolase [Spirochaetaceae bacterium]|nr:family 16 glycosylhydrolase [Spirochaetaceae bacterium]
MKKMNGSALVLCILMLIIFLTGCTSQPAADIEGWSLVWNDEFSGRKLDTQKWDYQLGTGSQYGLDGWGNQELQYYTKENIRLEKGMLIIEAKKEDKEGKPYTSGRIRTMKDDGTVLFAPLYGRIEARMQLPGGSGIWPAFWMLPADTAYGMWAASGEIDIMEFRGRLPNRTYGTLHYGEQWPGQKNSGSMYKFPEGEDGTGFHTYAVEWEPGIIRWYVDNNLFYETSSWWSMAPEAEEPFPYPAPYDTPFYILLNLAVGGAFDEHRTPDNTDIPAQMIVDYVRVYEKTGGYNHTVTKPVPDRDTASFESYRKTDEGNAVSDESFSSLNTESLSSNTMDKSSGSWYLLALSDFGGRAQASVENGKCRISIIHKGTEVHSVQLLQHLGIAKGYTYILSFEAKAEDNRAISVKIGGDDDNGWAVYSSQYSPSLSTEYTQFKYRFTMENESDASARLEFNVGKQDGDVWIKNICVTQAEF